MTQSLQPHLTLQGKKQTWNEENIHKESQLKPPGIKHQTVQRTVQ